MITIFDKILKNKFSGVYGILNIITGKLYVGSAINLHRRSVDHIYFLNLGKHHSVLLQRAWVKYSSINFDFIILEYTKNKNDLVEREQYWIDLTNCSNPEFGYNVSPTAGNCLGVKHTDVVKLQRSKDLTGLIRSAETRARMSAARKGVKIHSEESKLKISLAGKNRQVTDITKLKLSKVWKGRKHSSETIEKLKIAAKKRGNNRLGKKLSEESKKRMSEAQRKRHSDNNQWR